MRNEEPTDSEARFFEALSAKVPDVQDWYHRDSNGALWMIVSYDVVDGQNRRRETLRCDFDAGRLKAGSSPGLAVPCERGLGRRKTRASITGSGPSSSLRSSRSVCQLAVNTDFGMYPVTTWVLSTTSVTW